MQFSAQEWARLDMYIETPVSDLERQRLVADLQNSLRTQADKQLALRSLKRIVEADGIIVEVHPDPAHAISDGRQSLTPENFSKMVHKLKAVAEAVDRCLIQAEISTHG